jgi:hypothetical protein
MTPTDTAVPTATASPTVTDSPTVVPTPTATLPLGCDGTSIDEPRLKVSRNGAPIGDESMKLRGSVLLGASIDPVANGFTFGVYSLNGTLLYTRTIPPGLSPANGVAGWKVNGTQTKWTYRDANGTVGGITRVIIQNRSSTTPGLHKVKVLGKENDFQVEPPEIPVQLRLDLGPGVCATRAFNDVIGPPPACQLSLARLKCQ